MTGVADTRSEPSLDLSSIRNKDNLWWNEVPAPIAWLPHRHTAQTMTNVLDRCRCGAMRFHDSPHLGWCPEPRRLRRRRWLP